MIDLPNMVEGYRELYAGRGVAKCPAHDDKRPSLSIARGDDRWLIHCFAGCMPIDVMSSLGLRLGDLYDDHVYRSRGDQVKPKLSARDALAALDFEAWVVWIVASDVIERREIDDEDWRRLSTAVSRISSARALICPERAR